MLLRDQSSHLVTAEIGFLWATKGFYAETQARFGPLGVSAAGSGLKVTIEFT